LFGGKSVEKMVGSVCRMSGSGVIDSHDHAPPSSASFVTSLVTSVPASLALPPGSAQSTSEHPSIATTALNLMASRHPRSSTRQDYRCARSWQLAHELGNCARNRATRHVARRLLERRSCA
jgi:hypothetical protein